MTCSSFGHVTCVLWIVVLLAPVLEQNVSYAYADG